jgi:predicted CXXCH cytochrome family protein
VPGPSPALRAYRQTVHGSPTSGAQRNPDAPRGACIQCHRGGSPSSAAKVHGKAESGAGNALCSECHDVARTGTSYLGDAVYGASAHATSPAAVWPGPPARASSDAGKCVNCHDPHGKRDPTGLVPSLLRVRGEALCLRCHDGQRATDVATALRRPFRHPLTAEVPGGVSQGATGVGALQAPAAPGPAAVPTLGPSTCSGCHNPHAAQAVQAAGAAGASTVRGVARVRLSGGGPTGPVYAALPGNDLSTATDHEVCLRCHSGYARRPARALDLGLLLAPQNPSFHPVADRGRNLGIDPRAFAAGWSAASRVRCSDCHGSEAAGTRGPHGSIYEHLLRKRSPAVLSSAAPEEGDLCFDCHAFTTYGPAGGTSPVVTSRYPGHGSHARNAVPCWACHDSHGSATLPALLALRPGALTRVDLATDGATCTAACHRRTPAVSSYRIGYAR